MAKAVDPSGGWTVKWGRALAEELDGPKRGGELWWLEARHEDGRSLTASWNSRTGFGGAHLEDPRGEPMARVNEGRALVQTMEGRKVRLITVPQALKVKELKEVLADG